MITWQHYFYFAIPSIAFWLMGLLFVLYIKKYKFLSAALFILGLIFITLFGLLLWNSLDRPPLRTNAEIRLWFAAAVAFLAILQYFIWKYEWLLSFCILAASLFVFADIMYPDPFDKSQMPVLFNKWFIPHVAAYLVGFALLFLSALFALYALLVNMKLDARIIALRRTDRMVYAGTGFLTIGLLIGGMWAKEAWGHFWDWDPKETWAMISWMLYLVYLHVRIYFRNKFFPAYVILVVAGFVLLGSWLFFAWLPLADSSRHFFNDVMP